MSILTMWEKITDAVINQLQTTLECCMWCNFSIQFNRTEPGLEHIGQC